MSRCAFCDRSTRYCSLSGKYIEADDYHCNDFSPFESLRYENRRFDERCAICEYSTVECNLLDRPVDPEQRGCAEYKEFTYRW